MLCWIPLFCWSVAAQGSLFPERTPEEILRRVPVCDTRACCVYQQTLRRLPRDLPTSSKALEIVVLNTFLADRTEIEILCPK